MASYHYVYILQSDGSPTHFYVGQTTDLKARLAKHNEGGTPYTANHRPWSFKTAIAFTDPINAARFERYLKTSSGRAFSRRHL
ncbi:MAG: GIY-YIG nuclease family protein [Opitutaceae bacterium]|jgi:predicted GIY-YIG superfamily endonuclease